MTTPRTRLVVRLAVVAAVSVASITTSSAAGARGVAARSPRAVPIRSQMLDLINRARMSRGLPRLRLDVTLSAEALHHSRKMARDQRLVHTPGLVALIGDAGGTVFGENLGKGRSMRGIRDAWLRRPDTRNILLDGRFRHAGLGVVHAGGFFWVTLQAFD